MEPSAADRSFGMREGKSEGVCGHRVGLVNPFRPGLLRLPKGGFVYSGGGTAPILLGQLTTQHLNIEFYNFK